MSCPVSMEVATPPAPLEQPRRVPGRLAPLRGALTSGAEEQTPSTKLQSTPGSRNGREFFQRDVRHLVRIYCLEEEIEGRKKG
ncbi:hypothetical protein DAI22_02g145300 [Oryza sativa Japonica Group]|nr:hypothetical protein DAI22_02g145300 [Oryza sativa Japonica Group]